MPQTLLALSAVVAFSLYAFGRHQTDRVVERRAISIELELAATDLASARMAELLQLAWDEGDVGTAGIRRVVPTSGIGPDAGEARPASFDDIDDFHGLTETRAVALPGGSLAFTLETTVRYVDSARPDEVVAAATLAKEVRVRVTEAGAGAPGRPRATAELRRVITPTSL